MKKILFVPAVALGIFFASCGGGSESTEAETTTTEAPAATESSSSVSGIPGIEDEPVTSTIDLTGNDQMQFNKTLFRVKAGEEITLHLKNIGTLPAAAMSHNAVVLLPGTDVQKFGEAAVTAKDSEHIPQDMLGDVVAHTKMLGPGEEDTIKFKLDEAGVYDFVCTFPGHFGTMRGKIVAE
ncbi:MAG: hypothetical protein J5I50_13580 [Chitinophagaceae bacterium]|nr:hypothetical protein [Chitinophagaceae bacterium]